MQSDQLADILFKQEVQGKTAKELRALGKDELADRLEAQTLQEKFTKSIEKLKSVLVDVVAAFTPILDVLGMALDFIGQIISGLNSISPALTGGLMGAGLGFLIGGPPGALIGAGIGIAGGLMGDTNITPTIQPSMGTTVSTTSNMDTSSLKRGQDETNKLLKQYLDKGTKVNVVNTDFNNQMTATAYSIQ